MINIQRFECNPLQENCYIVNDDSRECIIIDCGAYYDEESEAIDRYIREQQLKPMHLLATHGHLDHNFGNAFLFQKFGLKVEICAADQQLVERLPQQAAALFGMLINEQQPPVGQLLNNGDSIRFGNHTILVLQTPGHSQGSCIFYIADELVAFSGDTLFRMSIGRTDFPEGSWKAMEQSLSAVVGALPSETVVYPGHGPKTTIGDELQYNPYLRH